MMTTPIPKTCLNEIQRLQRNFIWGDTEDKKRLHLIKWDTIVLPKECGGLGIKDLSSMNKSCMMKLAWNLRIDNTRLWSKVLQGKYGRGGSFPTDSQVKVSDSFIWKAICDCSDIINNMTAWSVGDGATVNFWTDKWIDGDTLLSDEASFVPSHALGWKVKDVTDSYNAWNVDQVRGLLPDGIINKLLSHPIPLMNDGPDGIYWAATSSGCFSVASAYNILCDVNMELMDSVWKVTWRLQVPERVRYFAWQVLHARLATKEYCGKWTDGDLRCHNCPSSNESILHVLRDCPLAFQLWQRLVPNVLKSNFFGLDVSDWVRFNLLVTLKIDDIEWRNYWAAACHHLWVWRNQHVHNDDFVRPMNPSNVVRQLVSQYKQSAGTFDDTISMDRRVVNVSWKAPQHGWVAINTDGAVKHATGTAACGGVLRDADGRWLVGFAKRLFVPNAYMAELWGALEGIKLARSYGYVNIELRMDSLVIVNCLSNDNLGSSLGRNLVNKIKQSLSRFTGVKIVHTFREANKVADRLANVGCTLGTELVIFPSPPLDVLLLVDADVMGVSTPRLVTV